MTSQAHTIVNEQSLDIALTDTEQAPKLAGDIAMWFFILAELSVFALFFLGFAVAEQYHPELFIQGKQQLHPIAGLINTLALLTSSLFVAFSVRAIHQNQQKTAAYYLLLALVCGFGYLWVKAWEYQALFTQGITIETNTFFTLYFLLTAFHALHIMLGMVILTFMTKSAWQQAYGARSDKSITGFESGACYWHMVDLLWVILFPLVYIIQ